MTHRPGLVGALVIDVGPLTEADARVLNQTRSENLRNNLAGQVKKMTEEQKSPDEIAAVVAEYDGKYNFSMPGASTRIVRDPVEKEARAIAREAIKEHLKKGGKSLSKTPEGETDESWAEKIENEIDRIASQDGVVAEARKRVKAREKAQGLAGDISL